mmetsp:Transcript_28843/g.75023  ORF Transcript_28843/g.75023 Transcript_28843/m.75023 type:complete len:213 (+) Transcript_28843:176-814(+)
MHLEKPGTHLNQRSSRSTYDSVYKDNLLMPAMELPVSMTLAPLGTGAPFNICFKPVSFNSCAYLACTTSTLLFWAPSMRASAMALNFRKSCGSKRQAPHKSENFRNFGLMAAKSPLATAPSKASTAEPYFFRAREGSPCQSASAGNGLLSATTPAATAPSISRRAAMPELKAGANARRNVHAAPTSAKGKAKGDMWRDMAPRWLFAPDKCPY